MKLNSLALISLIGTVGLGLFSPVSVYAQFSIPEISVPEADIPTPSEPIPSTLRNLEFQNVIFHDGCRATPRTVNRLSFNVVDLEQSGSSRPNWDLVSKIEGFYIAPEARTGLAFRAIPEGDNDTSITVRLRPNYDRTSISGINRGLDTSRLTIVAYDQNENVLANTQVPITPLLEPRYEIERLGSGTMQRVVVEGEVYYAAEMRVWNAGGYKFDYSTREGVFNIVPERGRFTRYLDLDTNLPAFPPFEPGQEVAALLPERYANFDNFPGGRVTVDVNGSSPYSFFDDRTTLNTVSACAYLHSAPIAGRRVFQLPTSLRPPSEQPPEPSSRAACNDGIDNDGDSLIDFPRDPGCDSASDTNEYNDSLARYRSLELTNCTTDRYRTIFWRRNLTSGGRWSEVGSLAPQYNTFGTCPHAGSDYITIELPQDGHVYDVVAVTPESIGCGRNDPNTAACVRDRGIFQSDRDAGVGQTYIY